MVLLISDISMWITNGMKGTFFWYLGYVENIVYFILELFIIVNWLMYVSYRIYHKRIERKIKILFIDIPIAVICLLTLTTPFTGWVFYIDSDNLYHRGGICSMLAVVTLIYIIVASIMSLLRIRHEVLAERKQECLTIALFAVMPLIGGTAQMLWYGVTFLWPCVTFSILLIFMDQGTRAISRDALTNLNNRGNLDRYLNMTIGSSNNRSIALVMMDINDFKLINDSFGHDVGDEILGHFADILRGTFSNTSAFLARYGGDEFVVAIENVGNKAVENHIDRLNSNIMAFNQTIDYGFELSAGIGYAIYPSKRVSDLNGLLKEADIKMYENKALYKEEMRKRMENEHL
jgi:diguanylate cyclase (GGDEF)-like protein